MPNLKALEKIKLEAKSLADNQNLPAFYARFSPELAFSRELFFDHPLVARCREDVLPFLNDKYGHGVDHAKKVALDASTIVLVEARPWGMDHARRLSILVQMSGLMHDTCRLEPNHAQRGGELASRILNDYPLSDYEREMVVFAIRNHEAFQTAQSTDDPQKELLSAALYDADKFRWGPDNFGTTLWEICDYEEWGLPQILFKYPEGIEKIRGIANTFRTEIGRTFGPEFIELGLLLGHRLYTILQQHCSSQEQNNTQ
ncbi:MAG TPA: hypothetical protein ENN39_01965 [Desulfonatronum sp.]|nr:hypothetical protein [Desulfonatronum sp.]